jgi:hypothetical protein
MSKGAVANQITLIGNNSLFVSELIHILSPCQQDDLPFLFAGLTA